MYTYSLNIQLIGYNTITSDHVGNEVSMAGRVEEIDALVFGFESRLRHIDRNSSTPLVLRLIQHPRVGEGCLTRFFTVLKFKI